jgi:glycosyltransferase involved in cell wall biosynthesis
MLPMISFVIPAFNEERFIGDTLRAIARHCRDADMQAEVVVVDNGSTDSTPAIAADLCSTLLRTPRASVSHARNLGANAATADFIAFIDADVVITREWVDAFLQLRRSAPPELLLTGFQYVVREQASWIEESWFKNLKDKLLNGGNIVISRAAFARTGGFDKDLKTGEDYDFCERAIAAGVAYAPDPAFKAIHMGYPRTIGHFVRREYWHGEGDFKSLRSFVRSPVAIIAIFYLLAQVVAVVAALLSDSRLGLAALLGLAVVNIALTVLRFHPKTLKQHLQNNIGNYLYFTARSFSLVRALKNRYKPY